MTCENLDVKTLEIVYEACLNWADALEYRGPSSFTPQDVITALGLRSSSPEAKSLLGEINATPYEEAVKILLHMRNYVCAQD